MLDYSQAQDFLRGAFEDKIKKTIVSALLFSTLLSFVPEIGWLLSEGYMIYMYVKLTRITTVPITLRKVLIYIAKNLALSLLAIIGIICIGLSLASLFTMGITSVVCAIIMFWVHYKIIYLFVDALREQAREHLGVNY